MARICARAAEAGHTEINKTEKLKGKKTRYVYNKRFKSAAVDFVSNRPVYKST